MRCVAHFLSGFSIVQMFIKKETGIDEIFKIYKIVIGGASKPMTGYVFSLKANKHLAY